ncbi:MAG TPA: ATP-binding protein, partial [Burkholderiaceae bacterium]|nr:ATP-binding protein [Burkholderiaceae bacterium]
MAISTTVAALLQYGLILPALGAPAPTLVLVLAILASAAYGGFWLGILASALALLIALDASFMAEAAGLTLQQTVPLIMLATVGTVASVLAEELHRARRRAERRQLALQKEIADRRVVERKVADSEARFRELAESLPDIMFATDASGTNVYTNQRWSQYTGIPRTPGGQAQRLAREAIHPDDLHRVREAWRSALASATPYETRHRLRGIDGTYRWFIARACPVWRNKDEAPRWFGVATDIDGQMRAEESLREADRRKDEFLAVLAHELRNPLAPIRHALQLIRSAPESPQAVNYARDVLDRQVTMMVRLIDDLLDVGRITSGKLALRCERVAMQAVIDAALETARPLIAARQQKLAVNVPPAPLMLVCDPARIGQVLANLLNNAARYTPLLGRITLNVTAEADPSGEIELTVRDDGVGIAPEAIGSIFTMFSQTGSKPGEGDAGLGVGLPLARALIALHGGSIEARSAGIGRGTELIVRLPRYQTPQGEPSSINGTSVNAPVTTPRGDEIVPRR